MFFNGLRGMLTRLSQVHDLQILVTPKLYGHYAWRVHVVDPFDYFSASAIVCDFGEYVCLGPVGRIGRSKTPSWWHAWKSAFNN